MLQIVQFQDTLRYGIMNGWTNIAIVNPRTKKPYAYSNKKRAIRKMNKLAKKFNKRVSSLTKGEIK